MFQVLDVQIRVFQLKWQMENANKMMQTRWKDAGDRMKTSSSYIQNQILENVQTMLDYVEETFEPVMLPVSAEAAKYSEDVGPLVTLNRIIDMTYRLNIGTMRYALESVKGAVDPVKWVNTKYFTYHIAWMLHSQ